MFSYGKLIGFLIIITHREIREHPLFNVSIAEGVKTLKENLQKITVDDEKILSNFLTDAAVLLSKEPGELEANEKGNDTIDSIEVVKVLDELGQQLSKQLQNTIAENETEHGIQISSYYFVMGIKVVRKKNFTGQTLPDVSKLSNKSLGADEYQMNLPDNLLDYTEETNTSLSSIVYLSYLPPTSMRRDAEQRNLSLGSHNIVSTSIFPGITRTLDENDQVSITIKKSDRTADTSSAECVYWNYTMNENKGGWSNKGCKIDKKNSNVTHVVCLCNHLTDFSILLSLRDVPKSAEDRLALGIITKVGCAISIVSLLFTVIIILSIRNLRKHLRFRLHINLSIALIVANICLLLGEKAKENEDYCLSVAVLTFFFYLSAFFWMLCEGIFIWRALVHVFTENDTITKYLLVGWGPPCIIVGITAILKKRDLVSKTSCWLSLEDGVILSFAIPAILIIVANLIILVVALKVARRHAKTMEQDVSRATARMTLVLLPLFGATWIFGVLAINEETLVFQYLFTILNSLQGLFIFICYICISKEVHKELNKWKGFSKTACSTSNTNMTNPAYNPSPNTTKVNTFNTSKQ